MTQWQTIDSAPHDGRAVLIYDGLGVSAASYQVPWSIEEWWDAVGESDETPDEEGYAEYLEETHEGWIVLTADGDTEFSFSPIHWMPYPKPPVQA